ncbi:hypothetical protein SEEA0100_12950, partial [Salmonella enterica subsp. enterica serovar Anatum str. USDA 100]
FFSALKFFVWPYFFTPFLGNFFVFSRLGRPSFCFFLIFLGFVFLVFVFFWSGYFFFAFFFGFLFCTYFFLVVFL